MRGEGVGNAQAHAVLSDPEGPGADRQVGRRVRGAHRPAAACACQRGRYCACPAGDGFYRHAMVAACRRLPCGRALHRGRVFDGRVGVVPHEQAGDQHHDSRHRLDAHRPGDPKPDSAHRRRLLRQQEASGHDKGSRQVVAGNLEEGSGR